MRLDLAVAALMLLQATPVDESLGMFGKLGSIGLAGMIFFFYRQDRKDSERRHSDLAIEYKEIVQENTAAVTKLTAAIDRQKGHFND